ncbi:MAG: dihydrodipicolinate synthase family protein [Candidatus Thorarchaeota archaeon]|nr:dihydrodipicolinate synthase family protein [Candidatus Thorarchaeota archaeon]
MQIKRIQEALHGVAFTTATPFSTNLKRVDTDAITANLEYLIDRGAKLLLPCGNTGEFYSLSEPEWFEVVQTTLNTAEGEAVVMPGVGGSITTAKEQAEFAAESGADAVMVMYPQHVFKSEEGLLNYIRQIAEAAAPSGVILYKKGPLMTDDVLEKLANRDNIVGVKYAYGRIVDFSQTVFRLGDSFIWSCGTAERFAPFYFYAGATGFTTGLGNFAPRISLALYDALVSNDSRTAMSIVEKITPSEDFRENRGKANNVPAVKAAMDYLGL